MKVMTSNDQYLKQPIQCKKYVISTISMMMMYWSTTYQYSNLEEYVPLYLPWFFKNWLNNEKYCSRRSICKIIETMWKILVLTLWLWCTDKKTVIFWSRKKQLPKCLPWSFKNRLNNENYDIKNWYTKQNKNVNKILLVQFILWWGTDQKHHNNQIK